MLMRNYAARHAGATRTLVLLAPGWSRTPFDGPNATFSIEEITPKIVDVLLAQQGKAGRRYLEREGRTVA